MESVKSSARKEQDLCKDRSAMGRGRFVVEACSSADHTLDSRLFSLRDRHRRMRSSTRKDLQKRDNTIDENTLRVQWFPACTKKCHIFAPDLTSQSLLSMTVRIHVDIHSQFPSLNNSIADDRLMGSPDLAMDAKYCYSTSFSNLRHVRLHQILPSCCMTG